MRCWNLKLSTAFSSSGESIICNRSSRASPFSPLTFFIAARPEVDHVRPTRLIHDFSRFSAIHDLRHARLALLWQIFSYPGFPNQFFCDSWVVGFWRSRPWLAGHWIGRQSLGGGSSRFWIGWVTRRGDACVRSTYRG